MSIITKRGIEGPPDLIVEVLSPFFSQLAGEVEFTQNRCFGNNKEGFYPYKSMISALSELTGKQAYKYRAFELMITLDLEVYKGVRRIIVPADIEFTRLHKVLQSVFSWQNYHLYDFTIFEDNNGVAVARLVPFEEDLE